MLERTKNGTQKLQNEIVRLNKIVQALMNRAELSMTSNGSDFGLFQTTILMEDLVHARTIELETALHQNEKITRELKIANERISHMARHDALTGLPNRVLLEDRIKQSIAQSKRDHTQMALLFIDLDKFKPVNDTLGHKIGDAVLKEAASRMRHSLREVDSIGRIGGDEFVVCLTQLNHSNDAITVARKIQTALAWPIHTEDHVVRIGSSIGVSLYPENGDNMKSLMQAADEAMYSIKQEGGGGFRLHHAAA